MNVADIIILALVGVSLCFAIFFVVRKKGRTCCDCERCQNKCGRKKDE